MRFWADHCARGEFLSVSRHLLAERPLLHRTGTEAKADPFSEERQCLPGGRRCGRTAGGCRPRPAESMHHPQTTQLLDLDPGTQVLPKGTGTNEPVAFLRHRANRILPQFRFQTSFPDPKLFERSCEIGLWRLTANRISEIFGVRLSKRLRGKLATVINQIEYGHHVFRAYWKNAFLKHYEKFSGFLRNELCSNNLRDFGLK